jgi:beta-lactamase class D
MTTPAIRNRILGNEKMRYAKITNSRKRFFKVWLRLAKIRNKVVRKELSVFSVNDKMRRYRQDLVKQEENVEEKRVPK